MRQHGKTHILTGWCDFRYVVISMANIMTSSDCSNMADSLPRQTTSSWVIMSTEANNHSRRSACSWHTRSNTQKTSSSSAVTTSVPPSTESMVSTTSAREDTTSSYGRPSPIASTASPLPPLLMRRSSPCTVV